MGGDGQTNDADAISLEIHHVNVTNGDGSIILVKQGDTVLKKVLIDISGLNQGANLLDTYCSQYGIGNTFDYMAVSHYHKDHMTGILKAQPKFEKYIDIGGYWQSADMVNPRNQLHELSAAFNKYKDYIHKLSGTGGEQPPLSGSNYATREAIPFIDAANYNKDGGCKDPQILTPHEIVLYQSSTDKISLFCVAADGVLADGTNVMELQSAEKQANAQNKPASAVSSPNNYSLAFILAWPAQDFYYYTAGDLSGDPSLQHYLNIEEPLVNYLKNGYLKDKPLSVLKADHHGSSYNTYGPYKNEKKEDVPGFLDQLAPTTIIVPTNLLLGAPGSEFYSRVKTWGVNKNNNNPEEKDKACVYFVNECVYSLYIPYPGTTYNDVKQLVNSAELPTNLVYWTGSEEPGTDGDPIENTRLVKQNVNSKNNQPCAVCIRVPSIGSWSQLPAGGGEAGGNNSNTAPVFPVTCQVIQKNNHDVWILSGSYLLPEGKNGPSQSKSFSPFPKSFKAPNVNTNNGSEKIMDIILNSEATLVWVGRTNQGNMDLVKNNLPKLGAWQDAYITQFKLDKNTQDDFIASLVGAISDQLKALYAISPKPKLDEYELRPEKLELMSPADQKTLFNFVFASQCNGQFYLVDGGASPPVKIYEGTNQCPEFLKSNSRKRKGESDLLPENKRKNLTNEGTIIEPGMM
ncbi:MAG: hypothetical protein PHR16_15570 [Methylovulum sp.]|nr:hypothetical protein [Methylovulum sp.]